MMVTKLNPWLISRSYDLTFILLPPIFVSAVLLYINAFTPYKLSLSPVLWLIFVVGIDVAHVYATLFRTYLDSEMRDERMPLLVLAPILAWFFGITLYSHSSLTFWRVLAYLAVFHFIRQQYGFYRLYEKKEGCQSKIGKLCIYAITLYPILYWHMNIPRRFSWFVEGDFLSIKGYLGEFYVIFSYSLWIGFLLILLSYVLREFNTLSKSGKISIPKNLLVLGTFLSWYGGIVLCNGDLTFTLTNVVCHGLPYIALVWGYSVKKEKNWKYSGIGCMIYILILLGLAYLEEGIWDFFVWNEHKELYLGISAPILNSKLLSIIVPLLTVPQMTHYFLDAFIWRLSKPQDHLEVISN